ncbi:unnamed protein product, partial [Vitis vinifera]|uniref:Uncharacterized protein n=1 Tax=Vitis vinifera TaxID=29760 RepID=D7SWL5_VITVI
MVCLILMSQKGLDSSLKRLLSMLGIKYQDLLCNPRFQDFKAKRCRHRPQMGTIIHALKCMPHMLFQCTKVTCDVVVLYFGQNLFLYFFLITKEDSYRKLSV